MRYRRGGLKNAEVGGEGGDHKDLELRGLSEENKYSGLTVVKIMRRKPLSYIQRARQMGRRGLKVVNTRDKQPMKPCSLLKN